MKHELMTSLADEINKSHAEALEYCSLAQHNANLAIQAAIRCGAFLAKAAEEMKGHYEGWLKMNTVISRTTAQRWRLLAHASHVKRLDLSNAQSLRQAYIMAGILPEATRPKGEARRNTKTAFTFVTYLKKSDSWLDSYFEKTGVENIPLDQLEVIAAKLEKSAQRHEEITKRIQELKEAA